jgi:hypothetical protein
MLSKILAKWKNWSTNGVHVPFIYDQSVKGPSMTLMFPYVTFVISILSIIALHFKVELFVATTTTLMFWLVSTILYMIRRITKAKIDLDDKSVELDSGEDNDGK